MAADVEAVGGQAHIVRLGLEDLPTMDRAVARVVERWGGIDVLVANAVRWGGDGPPDPSLAGDGCRPFFLPLVMTRRAAMSRRLRFCSRRCRGTDSMASS
ncbi:hypothetical protein GCM10023334_067040 [Nonomuraea thailandensis]